MFLFESDLSRMRLAQVS